jgi:hypothetical protein
LECRIPAQCRQWPQEFLSFAWGQRMAASELLLHGFIARHSCFSRLRQEDATHPPLEIELARKRLKELFDA